MIAQLLRFGCVGTAAAAVHLIVVIFLVSLGMPPWAANVFGFAVAFQVTYLGHRTWTFKATGSRSDYGRMLFVSLGSFAINEGLYMVLLKATDLDYRVALALVLITVAIFTYTASRLWVFTPAS